MKVYRLEEVLALYDDVFEDFIEEQHYDNFVERVIGSYSKLWELEHNELTMTPELKAYVLPCVALFKVLTEDYSRTCEDAINRIYQLTYKATEGIYSDLSFVQVAYYLMCNKPFLKQLMLHSLSEFSPTDIEDSLEEHEVSEVLNHDLRKSEMASYFEGIGKPELINIIKKIEYIIEEYAEKHFSEHQKRLTIADIY